MHKTLLLTFAAILFFTPSSASAFTYSRSITVDHTKVPNTNQTDFPVLVSGTYSYLATAANGGKVENASGYDVGFYTNSNCSTGKMSWETETYTATTGAVNYWVKVPTLTTASDYVFYLCYGDSSISTDQSAATSVWDSNFKGVYHLPDGTTLGLNDSTSQANNLTNTNVVTAGTGQVDGAAVFTSGSSNRLTKASPSFPSGTSPRTIEGWFKMGANQTQELIGYGNNGPGGRFAVYWQNDGRLYAECQGVGASFAWTYDTNWHHVVFTLPSGGTTSNISGYLDGVSKAMTADGGSLNTTPTEFRLSGIPTVTSAGYWFTGSLDEVRISSTDRSADWIATAYNNQSSPSTFYAVGAETSSARVTYRRAITVDHTKVGSANSTNFPVLVSGTYSYLATVANGGLVANDNGYDIGFYSNSNCSTGKLDWETETYTAATGAVNYWVEVPTLSYTDDTVFYMCYGNSGITTDQSAATSVWDTNFKGVWHLPTVTGGASSVLDSTSNANNGTPTNSPTNTTVKINGGGNFVSGSYVSIASNSGLIPTTAMTVSTWMTINDANGGSPIRKDTYPPYFIAFGADRKASWGWASGYESWQPGVNSVTAMSIGTPYHVVGVWNGTNNLIYINGVLEATSGATSGVPNSTAVEVALGSKAYVGSPAANAKLDEVRISSINRSASWILAEYNNQSSPSTFYAVGDQAEVASPAARARFQWTGGFLRMLGGSLRLR